MDSIMIGQLQEAADLGVNPEEVGCGSCGGGCGVEGADIGRASPKYSRALRRRLMACRADCESNLIGFVDTIVSGPEEADMLDVLGVNDALVGIDPRVQDALNKMDKVIAQTNDPKRKAALIKFRNEHLVNAVPGRSQSIFRKIRGSAVKVAHSLPIKPEVRDVVAHIAHTATPSDLAMSLVRNPLLKVVATGAAIVFPPATAIAAGLVAADKLVSAVKDKDPLAAASAVATAADAAGGNLGAINALKALKEKGLDQVMPGLTNSIDNALRDGPVSALQKLLSNPNITTSVGPLPIPGGLLSALVKNGPQAALKFAESQLKNPWLADTFKKMAAIGPTEAARIADGLRSGNSEAVAKATAQVTAITALAKSGDANAVRGLELLKKAKAMTAQNPVTPFTQLSHGRIEVCGAKSEESRGVWLKAHVYQNGRFLHATLYSVANADAEVFHLKVDLLPFVKYATKLHKQMHSGGIEVGASLPSISTIAQKMGRTALANKAFAVSANLAKKAACKVQTPNVPASNVALTALAAARTGIDAVDRSVKLQKAMESSAGNLAKLANVKKKLAAMTPAQRAVAMRDPNIRVAVLKGIGSKFAIKNFLAADGPQKAAQLKKTAIKARAQFATLAKGVKAGNPAAKKMAAVVSIAAKSRAKTQATLQNNEGGMAGLVIDAKGKVRRAKKFVRRVPKTGEKSQVLIPRHGRPQTGIFTAVAGSPKMVSQARLAGRLRKIRQLAVVSGMDIGLIGPQGEMDLDSPIPYDQYVQDPFKEYVPLYQDQGA